MTEKLEGVCAVVTGAGNGIGKAAAAELAGAGAGVLVFDYDGESAAGTAEEIIAEGGRATPAQGDVTSAGDLDRAVKTAIGEFGPLAVMVNFAGIIDSFAPCTETSEELWDRVIEVNLKGVFLGTKRALEEMLPQERGAIVNMSSYSAFRADGGGVAYAASKAGVAGFTRQVASEAGPHVRVNAVAPGLVFTDLFENSASVLGERQPTSPVVKASHERVRNSGLEKIPLNRGATPEEVAKLTLFLASEDASFITGQTYMIDGGSSIRNRGG